jgi:hypothetical protein
MTIELADCVISFYVKPKDANSFHEKCSRILRFRDIRGFGRGWFEVKVRFDGFPDGGEVENTREDLRTLAEQ